MTLLESQELRLTCTALTETQEHTHLSVSFGFSGPEPPGGRETVQEVIGVRRDFAVEASGRFAERHKAQELSVAKLGRQQYQMVLGWLRPEDTGVYHCTAGEWIRDPDGSWQLIAEKQVALAQVTVRTIAVVLSATAWLPSPTIYRGDTAKVRCNISVESTQAVHVALSWWVELAREDVETRGHMLASVSREGVAVLGRRPLGGVLSVEKVGSHSHQLRIHKVQPSDEGKYHCALTAWVRSPDLSWYNAGTVQSNTVTVYPYALPMDTLFIPLLAGVSSALFMGIVVLTSVTCCFMRRLRKRHLSPSP